MSAVKSTRQSAAYRCVDARGPSVYDAGMSLLRLLPLMAITTTSTTLGGSGEGM